ncbi:hypothetical protein FLAG1_02819 [Fusarium langsethiae]|uniref:Uncharacterized protein n=1 Tax=Fusarium langsethiae TaxID=179993 RepID=A0A0M9F235_FUSLA|nr:hypothetical protein FLAG1_02819 [Fusarium langsethiae]
MADRKKRPGNLPTPSSTEASDTPLITVISARYRAAWPQLRPRPLEWSKSSKLPALVEERQGEIQWNVEKILHEKKIILEADDEGDETKADVWLVQQEMAEQPHTSVPTISICASWSENKQGIWEAAVQAIAVELYSMFKDSDYSYDNFHIDMLAPELTQTIYYGPTDRSDLHQTWDNVRALVHQRLELFEATAGSMTAICLFHYGTSREINTNPATIYIAVNYSSDETGWLEVIADIKANINRHGRGWKDVQVHVEHNVGMDYAYNVLEPTGKDEDTIRAEGIDNNKLIHGDYQQIVKPGDDFSAGGYIKRRDKVLKSSGVGTLGCFVELKTKSNPTWKKYALINYHVIRPALDGFCLEPFGQYHTKIGPPVPNSDCWNVDLKGYAPTFPEKPLHLESPSRAKHNFTMWYLRHDIAARKQRIKELETQIQTTNDRTKQAEV